MWQEVGRHGLGGGSESWRSGAGGCGLALGPWWFWLGARTRRWQDGDLKDGNPAGRVGGGAVPSHRQAPPPQDRPQSPRPSALGAGGRGACTRAWTDRLGDADPPERVEAGREPGVPGPAPGRGTRPGVWAAACCASAAVAEQNPPEGPGSTSILRKSQSPMAGSVGASLHSIPALLCEVERPQAALFYPETRIGLRQNIMALQKLKPSAPHTIALSSLYPDGEEGQMTGRGNPDFRKISLPGQGPYVIQSPCALVAENMENWAHAKRAVGLPAQLPVMEQGQAL
nr:uncharacterized protein LOC116279800 [Vicugna pacos]